MFWWRVRYSKGIWQIILLCLCFYVWARSVANWPGEWGGGWMHGGAQGWMYGWAQGCKTTSWSVGPACTCVQCTGSVRQENYVTGVTRGLIEWTSWEELNKVGYDKYCYVNSPKDRYWWYWVGTGPVYGRCVRALQLGRHFLRPGDVWRFIREGVSIRRMWLSSAGQRKCISFVVITMCCVWWVYVRTDCVQEVIQRANLLHEIYTIDLNESGIPTPRYNYSGSYRGALTIMILVWPW